MGDECVGCDHTIGSDRIVGSCPFCEITSLRARVAELDIEVAKLRAPWAIGDRCMLVRGFGAMSLEGVITALPSESHSTIRVACSDLNIYDWPVADVRRPMREAENELRARVAELETALGRYGEHDWECPLRNPAPPFGRDRSCTCGLDDKLRGGGR